MVQLRDYNIEPVYREEEVFCECPICGQEILLGDDYYNIDGENICTDCILEHMKQYKEVAV